MVKVQASQSPVSPSRAPGLAFDLVCAPGFAQHTVAVTVGGLPVPKPRAA